MTCSILLLITLTSCVCAGTFVVNVTQSSYQAEENEDITLEWTFTTKPDSSNSLNIFCELITDRKVSVLYHLQEGVEVPESQDGQFAGRVQCDRDVLREGRLRLHVSRLRTEDSGLYLCKVRTTYGGSFGKSRLNVTAGTFVVNVTQSSYQAEENEDITLEWTFTTKPDSSNSLNIFCELITDHKASVLYHLHEGVEVPESQDGQFAGRVQCDRDVLREGRLRLHVSRLRTEDSGLYLCEVRTTYGGSIGKSRLTVTAGTFVVNVTQSSYQAEENEDITLEWTFTTKPDSSNSLNIFCDLTTDHKDSVLYHLHEGVEVPESQDGQFAGRVQCDRDVLREGRLRLHVSRLRTEDSGLYLCEVRTTYGGGVGESRLNVTAARDRPEPERPNTESRGRIGLYCALGLSAAAAVLGVCYCLFSHSQPGEQSPPSQSQLGEQKIAAQSSDGCEQSCRSADGSEETV
ncbi:uncharacterized protein LOC122870162 isoform X2 [Siniperca chuatsi]|uniref:uncharacterized protein LOC122870162 isoform X2 n=1 Tax=Siniperca chuatsi TaxID=119488 RepID=UPI001CE1AAF5|nr:uncharacterized protein LOC122870162 isoform X2 [Siniperca chuatsi]